MQTVALFYPEQLKIVILISPEIPSGINIWCFADLVTETLLSPSLSDPYQNWSLFFTIT